MKKMEPWLTYYSSCKASPFFGSIITSLALSLKTLNKYNLRTLGSMN